MATLTVITPCSRPWLLPAVLQSVPRNAEWVVVLDSNDLYEVPAEVYSAPNARLFTCAGGKWGNAQRTFGMSQANGEYLYFLDDDNIIHPRLIPLLEKLTASGERPVIVVNQALKSGELRLRATLPPHPNGTDTAQVLIPRELTLGHKWDTNMYEADGKFFGEIFNENKERFVVVNEVACYYNYLRSA